MIHYLRNENNVTIVDIETTKDDIHCVVIIDTFSEKLLEQKYINRSLFVNDVNNIQEIRAEWFEKLEIGGKQTPHELAKYRCIELAKKWNLNYVVD